MNVFGHFQYIHDRIVSVTDFVFAWTSPSKKGLNEMTLFSRKPRLHVEPLTGAEITAALDHLRSDQNRIPRYANGQERPFSIRDILRHCGRGSCETISKWRRRYYAALGISLQETIVQGITPSMRGSASAEQPLTATASEAALQQRVRDLEKENVRLKCVIADLVLGNAETKVITTSQEYRV
jgi:transposase-like protein